MQNIRLIYKFSNVWDLICCDRNNVFLSFSFAEENAISNSSDCHQLENDQTSPGLRFTVVLGFLFSQLTYAWGEFYSSRALLEFNLSQKHHTAWRVGPGSPHGSESNPFPHGPRACSKFLPLSSFFILFHHQPQHASACILQDGRIFRFLCIIVSIRVEKKS